jgi:hypothetical protein
MNVSDGNKRVLFLFSVRVRLVPEPLAVRLQVAAIVATHLLRVIKLWSCRVPIPFRAVGLVELFLGVIHRPGVRSIVVLAWFKILPCS